VRQVRSGFLARGGNGTSVDPCRRQTRTRTFSEASVSLDAAACNAFECAPVQNMVCMNLVGT
jgi:hypothetical protein